MQRLGPGSTPGARAGRPVHAHPLLQAEGSEAAASEVRRELAAAKQQAAHLQRELERARMGIGAGNSSSYAGAGLILWRGSA